MSVLLRRTLAYSALFGMLLLSGGCVYDKLDPCPADSDDFTVTFKIATQNTERTKADPDILGQETGIPAENWLDVENNIKVLLFSDNGAGNGVLLQDLTAIAQITRQNNGLWNLYDVTATFKDMYFRNPAFNGGDVPFYLMVLANWPSEALDAVAGRYTTIAELQALVATFAMPDDFFPELSKTAIPMYGLLPCRVSQDALSSSTATSPVNVGDVYMLRCLAKVEVIDETEIKDADGYPRIESVSLTGWNRNAMLIPADFQNGVQVTAPTFPDAPGLVTDGTQRVFKTMSYTTDTTVPPGTTYTFNGFTTYIPEVEVAGLKFTMEVSFDASTKETRTLTVPVEGIPWGTNILRNHIYRISAVVNPNLDIQLIVKVLPWDGVYVPVEFN